MSEIIEPVKTASPSTPHPQKEQIISDVLACKELEKIKTQLFQTTDPQEKIQSIKNDLSAGRYEINTPLIAGKMLGIE